MTFPNRPALLILCAGAVVFAVMARACAPHPAASQPGPPSATWAPGPWLTPVGRAWLPLAGDVATRWFMRWDDAAVARAADKPTLAPTGTRTATATGTRPPRATRTPRATGTPTQSGMATVPACGPGTVEPGTGTPFPGCWPYGGTFTPTPPATVTPRDTPPASATPEFTPTVLPCGAQFDGQFAPAGAAQYLGNGSLIGVYTAGNLKLPESLRMKLENQEYLLVLFRGEEPSGVPVFQSLDTSVPDLKSTSQIPRLVGIAPRIMVIAIGAERSPAFGHVAHVVGVGAGQEMDIIGAQGGVAGMAYNGPAIVGIWKDRNLSVGNNPENTRGGGGWPLGQSNTAVPVFVDGPGPGPTFIGAADLYLGPKSFEEGGVLHRLVNEGIIRVAHVGDPFVGLDPVAVTARVQIFLGDNYSPHRDCTPTPTPRMKATPVAGGWVPAPERWVYRFPIVFGGRGRR